MERTQSAKRNRPVLQLATGALVLILFFAVVVYNKKQEEARSDLVDATPREVTSQSPVTDVEAPVATDSTTTTPPLSTPTASSPYKDGTYTATGTYSSPGGRETVTVSLTIKNGIVTASTFTPTASSPTSEQFQEEFAQGYKQYVIGKDLSTLSVGKVAGSSLTGIGFNAAVAHIKTEAEA